MMNHQKKDRKPELVSIAKGIAKKQLTQDQLRQLFLLCIEISKSFLLNQSMQGKDILGNGGIYSVSFDKEIRDIAVDCVAGLFTTGSNNSLPVFEKFFQTETQKFLGDISAQNIHDWVRRIVIKTSIQGLSRIFKERDPEGARILRNIRVAVKQQNSGIALERINGRERIYLDFRPGLLEEDRISALKTNLPHIPYDILLQEFLQVFNSENLVIEHLHKILQIIKGQNEYRQCVNVNAVCRVLRYPMRELRRERLIINMTHPSPSEKFNETELESILEAVLARCNERIYNGYVKKKKLPSDLGDIYARGLHDVAYSMLYHPNQKGGIPSYHNHLKVYFQSLTQRQYRKKHRKVFEYLAKLLKKWIREQLFVKGYMDRNGTLRKCKREVLQQSVNRPERFADLPKCLECGFRSHLVESPPNPDIKYAHPHFRRGRRGSNTRRQFCRACLPKVLDRDVERKARKNRDFTIDVAYNAKLLAIPTEMQNGKQRREISVEEKERNSLHRLKT